MNIVAKNKMMGKTEIIPVEINKPSNGIQKENLELGIENRILEEVKAAIFLAKQFPRDEIEAEDNILKQCKRKNFAEAALYSFPRGNELVEGVTIRFAEALARAWGNIQYSVIELETESGVSTMLAYAWDCEKNIKSTRQFDVALVRDTKSGSYLVKTMRDQYEVKASYAARFLRGCILNLIPNYIVENAIEVVKKTMLEDEETLSIEEKRMKTVEFMNLKLQVTKEDLEEILNCEYNSWTENHIINLRLIYNGIKEGQLKLSDLKNLGKITDITDEQIKELLALDKKETLIFECKKRYGKVLLEKLTSKEYEEMKEFLTK
ncbi:MAG: hypothetical protein HUJ87_15005 [Fusobacterium varium]|uniref:hypothetical protein n=1 Tax=Fusobacterium varium TaxID=856 RepID=UPI00242C8E2B|nr:hypothetical protein [Fusobacterium varium]MCF0171801.1 hypothetical protein [Fusobacterium varium]